MAPWLTFAFAAVLIASSPAPHSEGRIAFTFGESGDLHPSQLSVMDADGTNRRALPPDHVYGLSWSPDGRSIVLGGFDIYTVNVDGGIGYRRVVGNGRSPDWSPDGRSIAFERGGDIWVVDVRDHRLRRVVRDGRSPSWSPDGRKLAFTRGPFYADSSNTGPSLWVLDIAAKAERRLVRNGDDADWSPDGRQIAFSRCRAQPILECFVWVMRSGATKQRRLFEGDFPSWSPNGQELVFVGRDRHRYADAVIRARLDGTGRRVLFGRRPYCGCGAPHWSRR